MSERAMNLSFLGMLSAVLTAIDIVSVVILVIMMLILGNTIAMGVRERTQRVRRARAPSASCRTTSQSSSLGEALRIGARSAGVARACAIAYPFVEHGMGRFIEENMGGFFPYFRIDAGTTAVAGARSSRSLLGAVAAVVPALSAPPGSTSSTPYGGSREDRR